MLGFYIYFRRSTFLNINRSYASHDLSCGIWNEKLKIFAKGPTYTVKIDGNEIIVDNIDL